MRTIKEDTVKEAIDFYGANIQATTCMEECAELIQCISKEIRGKSNIDHLTEEMADVCICIEALKQIYGISDEQMQTWIDFKQKRIEDRMLKGE